MKVEIKGGRGDKMRMRTIVLEVLIMLVLGICPGWAATVNFYEDGIIEDGDSYDIVNIWNDATVDMTGGMVGVQVGVFDSGTVNIYGGLIDGADVMGLDWSTLNLWGGDFRSGHRVWVENSAAINVYGYGFDRRDNWLDGCWVDGSAFSLYIRDSYSWERTTLHEIPEPGTILLFALGGFFLNGRT